MKRIGKTLAKLWQNFGKTLANALAVIALVFGSLITFPVYIPWMAGIWIACSVANRVSNKPMWPWLIGCVLIIAIKRPGFTLRWLIFSALRGTVALIDSLIRTSIFNSPLLPPALDPVAKNQGDSPWRKRGQRRPVFRCRWGQAIGFSQS